jgi:hypothetical protein
VLFFDLEPDIEITVDLKNRIGNSLSWRCTLIGLLQEHTFDGPITMTSKVDHAAATGGSSQDRSAIEKFLWTSNGTLRSAT